MADTKLTRGWVERELAFHENIIDNCGIPAVDNELRAALCRHYLATEQDARKYEELIYAVARKYPGETRHETALRYIRERESAEVAGPYAALTQKESQT